LCLQDDDSEEEGDSDVNNALDDLVEKLPAHLRQKVIMQKGEGDGSDSEESEEEAGEETSGWGKKKNFWSADTADLEIGQDVQDAVEEEEAAMVGLCAVVRQLSECLNVVLVGDDKIHVETFQRT
jgi:hypothetical protein